jgi:23S rRNA (uracil1939-C5)-methyltransferase
METMVEGKIEKNKNYIIDINDVTHEAQGVGRIDGLAVFVDGALEGERVEVKIIKLTKSYGVGKLISILRPSPHRIEPFCEAYKRCGGCNLQHLDYKAQLDFKTGLVRDNLKRIGGLTDIDVYDTIGMKYPYRYRNKAQYPVAMVDGKAVTGFYAPRSHDVIQSDECEIQDAHSDNIRKIVSEFMDEYKISAYDEKTGKGLVRHIVTRVGYNTGEIMVMLVINGTRLPGGDELVRRLVDRNRGTHETDRNQEDAGACEGSGAADVAARTDEGRGDVDNVGAGEAKRIPDVTAANGFPDLSEVKSIYLNINTEKTNVILGRKNILLYGSKTIADTIGRYKFMISPHSFFQVNPVQTEVLYTKALEYAGLTGKETVFDLYCGIGTISLFLSGQAGKVYGVEVVEAAIEDARRNMQINGVKNVEFIAGEAEKVVPELYSRGIRADVVILDPPRKGCDESLLKLLAEMQPDRIVYVSCNPATLARDLKYLSGQGYKAMEVQPVDMFPWSGHVECVTLMSRVNE